jgi:dsDNA-binding SOS-regulon protein
MADYDKMLKIADIVIEWNMGKSDSECLEKIKEVLKDD